MTTIDQARSAVYKRFVAQWAARTLVHLEGEKFTEPDVEIPWVRVSVRNLVGGQETLGPTGARVYKRTALAQIQVFTNPTGGIKTAGTHAQAARAIFEGTSFDQLDCKNGSVREVGPDGKFNQTNVDVEFDYYEIK